MHFENNEIFIVVNSYSAASERSREFLIYSYLNNELFWRKGRIGKETLT